MNVRDLRSRWLGDVVHDWQAFHLLIAERLKPHTTILDVGCGRGNIAPFPWSDYEYTELVGLDVDPTAAGNPNLDRFVHLNRECDLEHWPLKGEQFDLIVARYVLEHVADPQSFFGNVRRALKPDGEFLFLTPNFLHPGVLLSATVPHGLKSRLVPMNDRSLESEDVFPTRYRLNTKSAIIRAASNAGLEVVQIHVRDYEPMQYFDFSVPSFLLAYGYYEAVRKLRVESRFGLSIVGVLRRAHQLLRLEKY